MGGHRVGHRVLRTRWFDAPGGPGPFYRGLGFVPTGEVEAGKLMVASLPLV